MYTLVEIRIHYLKFLKSFRDVYKKTYDKVHLKTVSNKKWNTVRYKITFFEIHFKYTSKYCYYSKVTKNQAFPHGAGINGAFRNIFVFLLNINYLIS